MSSRDRRRFLQVGAGAAAAAVAGVVFAEGSRGASEAQSVALRGNDPSPSVHRFRLGAMEVTIVNDGRFVLPAEIFAPDVEKEERERYFGARHLPIQAIPLQLCPVLIDTRTQRILVDTGMGPPPEIAPESGWLTRNFQATGTTPEAIDLVVLTHGHADHYGGLLDPGTGKSRFPNAEVVIARAELEFWTDPEVASQNPALAETYGGMEAYEAFVARTAEVLNAVRERLRPIQPGQEIARGIHSVGAAGHTAGHIGVLAESGGEQLLLVGDAITNVHVAFEHPRWRALYDDDADQAIRTRLRLLDRAASEALLLSGVPLPIPGSRTCLPRRRRLSLVAGRGGLNGKPTEGRSAVQIREAFVDSMRVPARSGGWQHRSNESSRGANARSMCAHGAFRATRATPASTTGHSTLNSIAHSVRP